MRHRFAAYSAFAAQWQHLPRADRWSCEPPGINPGLGDIVARADARGLKLVGLYGASEILALFARQDESSALEQRMLAGGRPVSAAARVRARP